MLNTGRNSRGTGLETRPMGGPCFDETQRSATPTSRPNARWRDGAAAKPLWGFRFITVAQLSMAWWALKEGHIRINDLRVYFGCHELVHRRQNLERGRIPKFTVGELQSVCGRAGESIHRSIRRLHRVGLITWPGRKDAVSSICFARSPEELQVENLTDFWDFLELIPNTRRKVPVPRQVLLFTAGGARRAVIATTLAHMLWGLYYRRRDGVGECWPVGACKVSWIADTFGVGESSVKHARGHLVRIGLLVPRETQQRVMNRFGRFFQLNLEWKRPDSATINDCKVTIGPAVGGEGVKWDKPIPPRVDSRTKSTPPRRNRKSPTEYKTQKPVSDRPSGVCNEKKRLPKPTRRKILPEDLDHTARLLQLLEQFRAENLIGSSERDELNFVAAAEHARVVGTMNPPGLFHRLVTGKHWDYITGVDEDAASRRLKRHRGWLREHEAGPKPPEKPELSEDARFVRSLRADLGRRGVRVDALICQHLCRERPEWSPERYDAARREISGESW